MLGISSDHQVEGAGEPDDDEVGSDDSVLLNGPQLPANAIDQSAIDALLADM
jgi:hypothetical protein